MSLTQYIYWENAFDTKSVILIISLVINTFVALWLLFSRKRINKVSQQNLGLSLIFISIWLYSSWLNHFSTSVFLVTLFTRISFGSALLSLSCLVSFSYSIREKKTPVFFFVMILLLSSVTLFTGIFVKSAIPATNEIDESLIYGKYHLLWTIYAASLVIFSIYALIKSLKESKGIVKERVKYLIVSLIATLLLVLFFNIILPVLGNQSLMYFGLMLSVVVLSGMSWIVIQDTVFSVKYIIALFISHMIVSIILFLLSWGTQKFEQFILKWDITEIISSRVFFFGLFVAIVVAFFIENIIPVIRKFILKVFNISITSAEDFNNWLIKKTNKVVNMSLYGGDLVGNLKNIFGSSNVIIFIDSLKETWFSDYSIEIKDLEEYISLNNYRYFEKREDNIELIIPLKMESETFGLLVMFSKLNEDFYSREEIGLLVQMSEIITIATNRYIFYREQQKFNITLKKKIHSATLELEEKVNQLEEARRRERDMMDIIGHELRTPLSIIKIKHSLLRDIALDKEREFSRDIFVAHDEVISEAIEREIELLETMLSSAKIDAGKLSFEFRSVDLIKTIQTSILAISQTAKDKSLELTLENSNGDIVVYADSNRLLEVLDNFISNAVKYTDKGYVKVITAIKNDFAEIIIEDSGIGIPEHVINRLGEKFFRVQQYIGNGDSDHDNNNIVRPGGTGLGLYVAFNLVRLMGGKIKVESELGKGSKFIFTIPQYKGQKEFKKEKESFNVFDRLGLNKN